MYRQQHNCLELRAWHKLA